MAAMPVPTVAPVNTFTYCYIAKFNRYYFISDWVYSPGFWEGHLQLDVLASHKVQIGAMSEYIVRSADSYDGSITDITYPATTNITLHTAGKSLNFNTTGFYVIGLISNSSAVSEGAISYYLVSAAQMANIKSYLMSNTFLADNNLDNLPDMSEDLVKVLYNPFQYIVSCKFYPFSTPPGTTVNGINFGWWSLPFQAMKVPEGGFAVSAVSDEFDVAAHPQSSRGSFLNHAPYSEIVVYHPLIGTIPLDMAKINAGDKLQIIFTAETITGQGYFTIRTIRGPNEAYILYQGMTQIAIDIPLAQMNIDSIQVARTAVNTTGNIVSSAMRLDVGGAIAAAGNGILDALQCSAPVLQSSGAAGNRASFVDFARFYHVQRNIVSEDLANRGRPLCQTKVINTLSGYIKVSDAHVDIPCFDSERVMIQEFMEAGFYYE